MKTLFLLLVAGGLGATVGLILDRANHSLPGVAPTAPFIDDNEYYSADGCWYLHHGYWHPLRRCHIVRMQQPQLQEPPESDTEQLQ